METGDVPNKIKIFFNWLVFGLRTWALPPELAILSFFMNFAILCQSKNISVIIWLVITVLYMFFVFINYSYAGYRTAGEHGVWVLEPGVGAGGASHRHAHQELWPDQGHVCTVLAQVHTHMLYMLYITVQYITTYVDSWLNLRQIE